MDDYHARNKTIGKFVIHTIGHEIFNGKNVIDLGSGIGGLTSIFGRLVGHGSITAVDVRDNHLKVLAKTHPNIKTRHADLDCEWDFRSIDMALAIDILCHLKNWEPFLRNVCNSANHLILETAVLDSDDDSVATFEENRNIPDLSYNGFASVPSASKIEGILRDCGMLFERKDTAKLNNGKRVYDWKVQETSSINDGNYRRLWICTKDKDTTTSKPVHQMVGNPAFLTPGMLLTPPDPMPVPPPTPLPSVSLPVYAERLHIVMPDHPRVAICVSGCLRTFEKTAASFKHFILGAFGDDADYFIHTWDMLGNRSLGYDAPLSHIGTNSKMDVINRFFDPKKMLVENQRSADGIIKAQENAAKISRSDYAMFRNNTLHEYFSMLYSWKRSKDLLEDYEREHQVRYDIVIKLRTDLLFKNGFDLKKAGSGICVPYIGNAYRGAMNDMFAVGPHDAMITYLSIFNSVVGYLNNRETTFRPEWMIKHHLNRNGYQYTEEPIEFGILRPNGRLDGLGRA